MRRLLLQSEPKKFTRRRKGRMTTGRTGNNSSAKLRLFEGKRETASIPQVVVHDVRSFSGLITMSTHRSSLQQMMTTTIAVARGASVGGEAAEEITETGVQMMTDVQDIAMSRLDPVQSGLKLLPILPRPHQGIPSPFRCPTRQLLDQSPPSPPQ